MILTDDLQLGIQLSRHLVGTEILNGLATKPQTYKFNKCVYKVHIVTCKYKVHLLTFKFKVHLLMYKYKLHLVTYKYKVYLLMYNYEVHPLMYKSTSNVQS